MGKKSLLLAIASGLGFSYTKLDNNGMENGIQFRLRRILCVECDLLVR